MKKCSKCETTKDTTEFYRNKAYKDGLMTQCKACIKVYVRGRKERLAKDGYDAVTHKTCSRCSVEKPAAEFTRASNNKDGLHIWCRGCVSDYYQANKSRYNEWERSRTASDPAVALATKLRRAVRGAMKGSTRHGSLRHMPYTKDELVAHLISTLPPGTDPEEACDGSKWHIDHIRPVASFNLTGEIDEEFHRCWSLANLRLLPADENMAKSDDLTEMPTPLSCAVQDWIWSSLPAFRRSLVLAA